MERINLDAGSTSKVITIGSVVDSGDNECEQVTLEFGTAPGGVVIGATGSTTIMTDPETGTGAGTVSDPKPIRVGLCGIQQGEIASAGGQDWYSFEAAGGQPYIIEGKQPLNFIHSKVHTVSGALMDVSILSVTDDSDSQLLGEHTGGGFTLLDARVFFTPSQDGTYKVSIGAGVSSLTGNYTVSVRADDHADDYKTQAGVVLQPGESVTARLDSDAAPGDPHLNEWDWTEGRYRTTRQGIEMMDDRDWFRYEITNAGTYELYLSGNPADTRIWNIYDRQENTWAGGPSVAVPVASFERHYEPGTYYVEVGTSYLSHANTGASYTLHLEAAASGSTGSVRSDAPQTPTSLDVVPYDSGELVASWIAPDTGPVPTGYTVRWKESGNDWADQDDVSEAVVAGTSHTISGLTDGTEYAVRVIANRDDADSGPSSEVTATPAETTPPELSSASVDGATLTLTFDDALDTGDALDRSAFTVTVAGSGRGVDTAAVSGSMVTLTLVTEVAAGDTVTVDYTAPTGESAVRLQDLSGNAAPSFSGQEVTNDTAPEQPLEPSQTERSPQGELDILGSPTGLQVARHGSGKLVASWIAPDTGPVPTGYTVRWKESGDDWADRNDVSEAHITNGFWHIITGLTDGTEYAVRVIATTDDAESEPSGEVTATPAETTPPELSSASVDGARLTLTFNEALDTGETPDRSAFPVTVAGSGRGVDTVAVSGSAVTLTLVTAALAGDAVTLDYTAPTDESAARLRDLSGNAAESFSGQAITNNTAPDQTEEPSQTEEESQEQADIPSSPTGLQVALHESGQLLASWSAPGSGPAPTGYTVQWKESGDDWADQDDVSEAVVAGTSHTITGLTDGTEYAVRVIANRDDADSGPSSEVTATPAETTPPELSSASVDGATLTLTFDEALDTGDALDRSAFTVTVAGSGRGVDTAAVSGSMVTLTLVTTVSAGDAVTVDYTTPTGESAVRLQDLSGNAAPSFSGQEVTNDTRAADPLTASAHDFPAAHNGSTTFTFEVRFSETPREGFSYKTLRDNAFTVTGGEVVKARRLEAGKNVRWEISVTPDGDGPVIIVLPVTTDCDADGAVCTDDGRMLSSRLELTVPGP